MVFYSPHPNGLCEYAQDPQFGATGQFMRDIHRLSAEGMVVVVALHMFRTFLTGSYKAPRQFTWLTGVILLILTLGLSLAVTCCRGINWRFGLSRLARAWPKKRQSAATKRTFCCGARRRSARMACCVFYLLHIIAFPGLCALFIAVHYYKVIRHGHSLPPGMEAPGEDNARKVPPDKRVPFLPDILTNELLWLGLTLAVLVVAVTFFYHAALEHSRRPARHAAAHNRTVVFPVDSGLAQVGRPDADGRHLAHRDFLFLAIIPYIDFNPSRLYKDRRIALALG